MDRHRFSGLLFEPYDHRELSKHVITLLSDTDLRRRFGRNGRTIVENEYSLDKHGSTLLDLYRLVRDEARVSGIVASGAPSAWQSSLQHTRHTSPDAQTH
jgi:hypothetical protein